MNLGPRFNSETGSVSVLVAAMIVTLLGFAALAVDIGIGLATAEKRTVVTAADAAALAAAQELVFNPAAAQGKAIEYAVQKNGADADKVTAVVSNGNSAVTVQAGKVVHYGLARVLGFQSVNVSARATAIVGSIVGMRGIVPLAAPDIEYQQGMIYELKVGQWKESQLGPGNFNPIAPGKPGASDYRDNEIAGFGPIELLLKDPDVSEIMVIGPKQVYVERKGKLHLTDTKFKDDDHVLHTIEKIILPPGRRIDEASPLVDARRLTVPGSMRSSLL